jgi:hypothetical protein
MRLRKVGLAVGIAGSVVLGSSVAWATTSGNGIDVCVPKAGAVSAPGPNDECPKGSTRVAIGDLDGVRELEARIATLEGSSGGSAGATEARVVTPNWATPTCPDVAGWHFVTCKTDPSEPQFSGPDYLPPNIDYGVTIDGSNYPEGTTWAMDLRYLTRGETCVRLFDVTANAPVAGSQHCLTGTAATPAKGRSVGPSFTLPSSPHDYLLQSTNSMYCLYDWYCTSAGSIKVRELVANW